jgi:hypothetical protein
MNSASSLSNIVHGQFRSILYYTIEASLVQMHDFTIFFSLVDKIRSSNSKEKHCLWRERRNLFDQSVLLSP